MIQCFRHLPMGAEVLLQMDRLVTLLETPCFTSLRWVRLAGGRRGGTSGVATTITLKNLAALVAIQLWEGLQLDDRTCSIIAVVLS